MFLSDGRENKQMKELLNKHVELESKLLDLFQTNNNSISNNSTVLSNKSTVISDNSTVISDKSDDNANKSTVISDNSDDNTNKSTVISDNSDDNTNISQVNLVDLENILNEIYILREKSVKLIKNKRFVFKKLPIKLNTVSLIKDDSQEFIEQINLLQKEIANVDQNIKDGKIPTFNFYLLKRVLTKISLSSKTTIKNTVDTLKTGEVLNEETNYFGKIIILKHDNDREENIPIVLENGKKIILTPEVFDLSLFTSDELLEILRFLDVCINNNNYDLLKAEITKYLSHNAEVSIISK